MRKHLYRIVAVAVLLAYAIPLSFSVSAAVPYMELTDAEEAAGVQFGPGSDCPLKVPIESGYAYIYNVEPVKAKWTIYDPSFHYVTTIEHVPALKQKITSGEHAGKWLVADKTAFTLPAFAEKGTWYARCTFQLADSSESTPPVSAEEPEIEWIGIPCTLPGSWTDFFTCSWYFFGWKAPAMFWFPFGFIWVPLLILGILLVWTRSAKGVAMILRGAWNAGKEFKRTAKA